MHQHRALQTFALAITCAWIGAFTTAYAATPALLIGPDLKPREVNLQALGNAKISYFDADRTMQVESADKVLQIRFSLPEKKGSPVAAAGGNPDGFIEAPVLELTQPRTTVTVPEKGTLILGGSRLVNPPLAFVELIDGQRVIAEFQGSNDAGEQLRFKHELAGDITIALDKVARLAFDGSAKSSATPANDLVMLSNGDVITGFVVAVKDKSIEVQQGSAKPFTLPRDRVTGLHLANPVSRAANVQSMIWLRDGSRLLASQVSISGDKLTMTAPLAGKADVTIDLSLIARIELASKLGQLIDLAELPMSVTAGGTVFGLKMQPRMQGDVIRMHAPVTVVFELPPNARRLAATAELDADGEDTRLAAFILSLHTAADTDAAARHAITGSLPTAAINIPLTGKTLTLTLDPADNGPVLDRLRLRDAVIFVGR